MRDGLAPTVPYHVAVTRRGILHLPVNTLALRRGGLIKAVMLRANALAAEGGHEVVIEVLAFQPYLEDDVAELVQRGFLDPRVHVRSVLRCLDPSTPGPSATDPVAGCAHHGIPMGPPPAVSGPVVDPRSDPRAVVLAEPTAGLATRLVPFRRGVRVPVHNDAGRVRAMESFDARGTLLRRDEIGSGGRVVRILGFVPGEASPVTQRWIGRDGRCFLAVWWAAGSRDWSMAFAAAPGGLRPLPDPKALYRLAFEHVLRGELDPVVFSEFREGIPNVPGRGFDDVVLSLRHAGLRRVAVIHSNHALQGQKALPLRSSPNFTALLTGLAKWDLVVTATEQQRADIAEQYGEEARIAAIPHYTQDPPAEHDEAYDPNRFVLVARIHVKKRVDEAIEAFRLVVDANPAARLEVYGFGYGDELEARITDLVRQRNLSDNVEFRGFVSHVGQIYEGACASLQTSQSEGFGMALLESLAHGVPVVAYDVSYGAREAIRDGVDGFVVPWGDRAALAERMVQLSTDPELRARLAAEGPAGAARFSRARYVEGWRAALDALPVRGGIDPDLTIAVTPDGTARFRTDGAGTVILRRRNGDRELSAELRDGTAEFRLPEAEDGDIYDLFVRPTGSEEEVRAMLAGGRSQDPTWRAYTTKFGYLSLKKGPAVGTDETARPPLARLAARRIRRLAAARSGRLTRSTRG